MSYLIEHHSFKLFLYDNLLMFSAERWQAFAEGLPNSDIIRIYHECEGRIEIAVPRIAVWHHETCRVMANGDHEGRIFLSYIHLNNRFFIAHHCFYLFIYVLIYFKISFHKSLNTLRSNFT